jgi:hypothetical protein
MVPIDALIQASERRRPPIRSVRRATVRRASSRRADARSRPSDLGAGILDFLAHHPRSSIGDLAKRLNFDPGHVATCLTHLTGAGNSKGNARVRLAAASDTHFGRESLRARLGAVRQRVLLNQGAIRARRGAPRGVARRVGGSSRHAGEHSW